LIRELKDALEKSTAELGSTNKIVSENGTQLALVQSELNNIGIQVGVIYKTVVTGGNGRDSLVSRMLVAEQKLEQLEKKPTEERTTTSVRWAKLGVVASILFGVGAFIISLLTLLGKQ